MNKAHKTIWSEASGTWIAVSENTNARGKPSRSARHLGKSLAVAGLSVAGLLALMPDAQATTYGPSTCNNPSGAGPDGLTSGAGTAPTDGSGQLSNVIGCNASGGNYLGVQILGYNAAATGAGAVALGYAARGAQRGTGVGMQAQATGAGSTALGQWTRATAPGSVAIGGDTSSNTAAAGAQATGAGAVAIAGQAQAAGDSSVAIGQRANAVRNGDVAIGADSRADGTTTNLSAVAVGRGSTAIGEDAIALGNSSNAQANYGAAIGNFATVTARNATAIGNSANSGGVAATAIGNFSNASAANAVAIGGGGQPGSFAGAQASGSGAVAIGGNNVRGAVAAAASGIALGGESNVQAGADSGIAIGRGAQVLDAADYGIAQGDGAIARSQNDIAIGRNAATAADSDGNNIALGNGVATGNQGHNVAIGSGATTANSSSASGGAVAIGRDQKAIGDGAVALGDPNTANGTGAVALGAQNVAAGDAAGDTAANGSVAIGSNNRAIGQGSVALGNGSTTTDAGGIALGDTAATSAANAIAIGSGSSAANAGDVALGSQSRTAAAVATTATTIDGRSYQFAGTAPASTVSVGDAGAERTITNVAAGRVDANSTDAINGSQLFAANQAIEAVSDSAVKYDRNPDDSINYGSVTLNPGGDPARLGNVAAGDVSENSTDAINGSQLHETNQQVAQNTGDIAQIGDTITNIAGDTSQANTDANGLGIRYARTNEAGLAQSDAFAQGEGSTAVGYNATASADSALALGREAEASHAGSVALGANAVADGTTLGTAAYNPGTAAIAGTAPVGEVSIGSAGAERRITNVAAGATDTDAVNVSQLKSVASDVSNLGDRAVRYDGNPGDPKTSISLEGSASTDGGRTGGTRISNVARGDVSENSTDAINGSQLHETNQQVAQNTGDIAQIGDTITNIAGDTSQASTDANGMGIRYARTNEAGLAQSDAFAQGEGSTAVGYNATASADSALALGREAEASHAGSVALGANAVADGTTLGTAAYNPGTAAIADTAPVGEVSIGAAGAERRITNVAAGATDTDAVNVSQLKSVASDVSDLGDRAVRYDGNPGDPKTSISLEGPASTDGGRTGGTRISNVARGDVSENSTDAVNGSQLHETNQNVTQLGDTITNIAGDTSQASTDANGMGIRYARTNEAGLAQSDAFAQGEGSTAVGYNATASADSALALGREAQASHAGSVALGANAVADGSTLGTAAYNPGTAAIAGTAPVGEVSIGSAGAERRITNVAAGATDTDAVNVSQLKSVASDVSDLGDRAVRYDGNPGDPKTSISLEGPASTDGGRTGGTTITNVARGDVSENSTDAVNGSQLHETNQQVAQNTGDINQIGDTITNIAGDTSQANTDANGMGIRYARTNEAGLAQSDAFAQGQGSTAVGYNATATADSALALGREAQASHAGSVALGANAVADGTTLGTAAYNPGTAAIAGTAPVGEVSVGSTGAERRITHVAAGATDTDAVNVSQLKSVASDVSNLGDRAVRYDGNPGDPKTSISLEGPASTDGGRTGGTTITNVARGDVSENSTDAVNGSQLHETNQQVAQNTGDINQIGDTITHIAGDTSQANTDANGMGIRYARTNEAGLAQSDAFAQGQGSTAVGYNATASADSALALGRETHANVEGSVALGAGAVSNRTLAPDSGSIAAGSGGALVPFNTTDRTLLGAVSVGSDTTYRQITNVADGTGDHDAVTVRQLTGAITSVTVTGTRYFHANSTQEDSLAAGTDSIAIGPNTVVNGNDGIGMGNGAVVEQNAPGGIAFGEQARSRLADGIAIGTHALADAEQGVALGTASRVSVGGGVALGAGSIADTAAGAAGYVPAGADGTGIDATRSKLAAVSVGDVAAGEYRQITGVAAGTVDTDAVNVSQLKALASNVDDLDAGAVKYDRNPDGSIDYESVTLNPDGDPTRLRNVAAGDVSADSTDAINGSQLHETNQNVTQLGDTVANIAGDTSQANTDANGMGIRYARTNEAGLAQSDAFAQGQGSTAVGYNATASADSALALGREAQASHAGSVALGANAVADGTTLGTAAYNPGTASIAGTAPVGEVSVGSAGSERRITHVAAGATDTDAVNVSQLKAVATDVSSISDRAVRYDGNPGDPKTSISLEGPASTDGGRTGGTRISNVARGDVSENSTDAVNGSQLHETNQQVAQNTGDINQIGDTITNIAGDTGQANTDADGIGIRYARTNEAGLAQSDAFAQGQGSTAVGYNATATADSALALGREAQASHAGSVALGANAVADGATLGTAAYNPGTAGIAGTAPVGEVSIGAAGAERRITNVAAGATDTDAVNVSQLKAVATDVSSISDRAVRYDGNPGDPKTSISLEGPASTDGGRTGGTRISNVARGDVSENSTDAINGSQLHETNQQVAQNTGDINQIGDTITNIAGDTSQASTDANGLGIRYARTNEAGLAQSDAFAQGQGSTAVGYNATATADSALALGREAQASHAGSVALGANAVADGTTLGTAAYNPGTAAIAGTAPVGEVSIGSAGAERRITNVAAGATDTDAVNVSQLKAVDSKFQDLIDTDTGIKYFHANSQAADSRALGAESIAIGPRALAEAEQAIALGDAATAAGAGAIALGSESEVRGARAASLGSGNNVSGAGAFALGNNNTVAAANAFVLGSNVSILDGNLNGAVVLGNGSTVTAARATAGGTINGTEYVYAGGNPAAGDVLSVGSALAPRQIQNVAAGRIAADSTDAVNGSQLHATNQAIDSLGMTVNSIANGGAGVKYFHANGGASAALPDSQANGLGSVAAGPAAVASGANSVAMGNGAVAHKDGDVALGAGSVADRGAESYTGKYSGAQNDTVGTVSVGAPGAERTVSNVADGRNATDAVNVRQLEGAVKEANEYTDKRITEVAGSVVEVGDKIDKIDNRVTAVEGDVSNIKNGADGMFQVSQGDTPPPAPKASGSNSTAGGAGAVASGKDSTAIGNGAQATGAGATAVGQGSKASGSNSVALGTGSEASRDNSVSVGSEGSERQIINVARGTSGTDAVNVNQLREVESGLSNQVAGVRRDLQRLDSRLSAGIAGAMAMSGLPQAYLPGKSMFSMGGATWRGESGFAMGLSSVSENGKWVVKGLANSTSRGDVGAAVGVGYQW